MKNQNQRETVVVKLGGAALQDKSVVTSVARDLRTLSELNVDIVLVHGGGPAINSELTRRGITWEFVDGQRVTTPEMMDVIEMVLCGSVNRQITRALLAEGIHAVGFSGVDGATLYCKEADQRLGRVGIVDHVNPTLIKNILNIRASDFSRTIPVIAPVGLLSTHDTGATQSTQMAQMLSCNINADWAATQIATALQATQLIFMTDQDGILDSEKKLITSIDVAGLNELIRKEVVQGGMLAKTRTVIHALANGVDDVRIVNARTRGTLIEALSGKSIGTRCHRSTATTAAGVSGIGSNGMQWQRYGL